MFAPLVDAGAARGLRHVAYSRPGYGQSDRQVDRTVADCAADVSAIADELGFERFFTIGWFGGGPHALACAVPLPERTIAAATLAAVAPWHADGLDWLDRMGAENIEEFGALEAGHERGRGRAGCCAGGAGRGSWFGGDPRPRREAAGNRDHRPSAGPAASRAGG